MTTLLVAAAGLLGTLARYWLSGWIARRYGETFPLGTLAVNLVGCFAIGLLYNLWEERFLVPPAIRAAVMIGLLGGSTTFSSFGLQTFLLLKQDQLIYAAANILVSNLGCLIMVWAGYVLSRTLL